MRLSDLTTLRLGGPAARYLEAANEQALVDAVTEADQAGEPLLVLAGGSNVVVADEGFPGTVVRIATRAIARDGATLEVAAGEPWDPLVADCVAGGLAGVECLAGIPGSVGATPIQNVGAYGQEVAETISAVRVLDRADGAVRTLAPADCAFTYRSSAFKREPGRWLVLAVSFALEASAALGADPLSRARPRPGRRGRRAGRRWPTCARRSWRCGGARAWSSTPTTPTPSRRARSSPTRCSTPTPSRR